MAHLREPLYVALRGGCRLRSLCKMSASQSTGHKSRRLASSTSESRILKSPYPDVKMPDKTYVELIWERHNRWATKTAVECSVTGTSYTYDQLLDRAEALGCGMLNSGVVRRGQVIAFLMYNSPDYIAALLGASWAGLTVCSINPLYTADEIVFQLKNSGAKSIVTFPDKLGDVMKAVQQLTADGSITSDFQVISTRTGMSGEKFSLPSGIRCLDEVASSRSGSTSEDPFPDLAFIAHSSGTTGLPKGVCLTHSNFTANLIQISHPETTLFKETSSDFQDVMPMFLPIFHNFGLEITLQGLYHGSKIVTLPRFEENLFLASFQKHKATLMFAAPPTILFVGRHDGVRAEHFQHLRVTLCAAAPIDESDISRFLTKTKPDIFFCQAYGQTEATCCVTTMPLGVKKYGSVGIPVLNTRIKVSDTQSGETNPEFTQGELIYKGPQAFSEYLNNPTATEEVKEKNGWIHTGDIGYYDTEGYLYIVDRMKELIKVKGFQVAPAELEAVLRTHPGVEDAAVTGMPDERKGEVPVGFIKIKPKSKLTEQDLKMFLSEKVAPFKMIKKYIFVDQIPKSPSGKILRKDLKVTLKNLIK